ncbi:hypothetical protein ACWGJ9_12015 [Curtobacterium citreum]
MVTIIRRTRTVTTCVTVSNLFRGRKRSGSRALASGLLIAAAGAFRFAPTSYRLTVASSLAVLAGPVTARVVKRGRRR